MKIIYWTDMSCFKLNDTPAACWSIFGIAE